MVKYLFKIVQQSDLSRPLYGLYLIMKGKKGDFNLPVFNNTFTKNIILYISCKTYQIQKDDSVGKSCKESPDCQKKHGYPNTSGGTCKKNRS